MNVSNQNIYSLDSKGFSLIELLVVVTVLGFLSTGIATLLSNQMNTSTYLDDKASRRDLKIELDRLLSDPTACIATLASVTIPGEGIPKELTNLKLKNSDGSLVFETGNSYDKINLNFELKNLDIASTETDGITELTIKLNRQRSSGQQMMQSLKYRLATTVDLATRAFSSCISESSSGSGVNDCLRPVEAKTTFPVTIPTDIDAIEIVLPYITGSYETGGSGPSGSDHHTCTVNSKSILLKLDGKFDSKLISGKTLTRTSESSGFFSNFWAFKYNGLHLANARGSCGKNNLGQHETYYEQILNTCRKAGDPNLNANQSGVVFYKYNSEL